MDKGASALPTGLLPSVEPVPVSPADAASIPSASRTLKERLARYLDPKAFEPVPNRVKFTCAAVGKTEHDKKKARREIAKKQAETSIRFFMKPENAAAIQARSAARGIGDPA